MKQSSFEPPLESFLVRLVGATILGTWLSVFYVASADDGFIFSNPAWHFVDGFEGVDVRIYDQIDDGCWARPKVSETQVSLELIRHGYKVFENDSVESVFAPDVSIGGLGYADAAGLCIVTLEINVYAVTTRRITPDDSDNYVSAVYSSLLWSTTYVLSGNKASMNQRIADAHAEMIREFLLALEKNSNQVREEILDTVPENRKATWRSYLSQ